MYIYIYIIDIHHMTIINFDGFMGTGVTRGRRTFTVPSGWRGVDALDQKNTARRTVDGLALKKTWCFFLKGKLFAIG